jgi:hypothetical protein
MKINFVGSFTQGYVGETADETHLADNLEKLSNEVQRVPRDIWKAYVDGRNEPQWKKHLPIKADINIICKWHHFNNGKYIKKLKEASGAPVFYWVWDFMYDKVSLDFIDWHKAMGEAADLLLTNEGGLIPAYEASLIKAYYFPFDVADETMPTYDYDAKKTDVTFFGSYLKKGDRVEFLKKINKEIPVKIFSWNYQEWEKEGFDASPAVYGINFNIEVAKTKICLQMSVNDHTWGYWSNRVGKTLVAGGFLLARYTPGMELFLKDAVSYFNTPEEAIKKIKFYLKYDGPREVKREMGAEIGRQHFSSWQRCKELTILMKNYLNGGVPI